jgi:hypothetical protein
MKNKIIRCWTVYALLFIISNASLMAQKKVKQKPIIIEEQGSFMSD